jgi:hypothetical protein
MYFLRTYECGTVRWGKRENNERDEPNQGTIYVHMEILQQNFLYNYHMLIKTFLK